MFFPISGVEIAWYIPPLATFLISFVTSMSGLSGAFLLLPFQVIFLGYTSPSVSATNQFYNIVAIPSGVLRYKKEKRLLSILTFDMMIGAIPGVLLAGTARSFLITDAELFRKYAACILVYLTYRMIRDFIKEPASKEKPKDPYSLRVDKQTKSSCTFSFDGASYTYNRMRMRMCSCVISAIGGIYGIGGGAFFAPLLLSYFKLPVYATAGANLFCTLICSIVSVLLFFTLAIFFPEHRLMPDYLLGTLFGLGGLVGMTLGSKMQKYVSARLITFCIIVILVATCALWIAPLLF